MTDQAVTLEKSERDFYDWRESPMPETIQDRAPNFRDDEGKLYLVRCFACESEYGRENLAVGVAAGMCVWCGWKEEVETKENEMIKFLFSISLTILALIGGLLLISGIDKMFDTINARKCTELAEDIERSTRWQDECQVEIAPGLWVSQDDIVYYLDFVE